MSTYLLAHDLGTSGNKATLYDVSGNLVKSTIGSYNTYYPFEGAVEHNPDEWWKAVCDSTKQLLEISKVDRKDIACVSFSGIMLGTLIVDKDGVPIRNMLIWADTRSSKQEKEMLEKIDLRTGYKITGHRPSASYSAAKLLWIKENEPDNYKKAHKMIHCKDYIVFKLTGHIVSDYSDASSTNLLDLTKKQWSDELVRAWDIRPELLPQLHASTDVIGGVTSEAAALTGLVAGTPVVLGGGDGSCAAVGAGVVHPGNTYNVIGTSSWVSMAAEAPYFDDKMRTFTWVHLDKDLYTPCGTMQAAGYSYSWYKDVLCEGLSIRAKQQGKSVYDLLEEELLASGCGANGMIYLPYLLGERSPLWDHKARGAFIGMGANTSHHDFTRAVIEGVTCNLKTILDILSNAGTIDAVTLIGGGAKSAAWLQIIADIFGKQVNAPKYLEEATSMGAAICGGIGVGIYKNFDVINDFNRIESIYVPNVDERVKEKYARTYEAFTKAYEGLKGVFEVLVQNTSGR